MATPPESLSRTGARVAIVLGSGLASFVDGLAIKEIIPYDTIPGLPVSRVPGHAGRFVVGELAGMPLLVAQGRAHLYEGWTAQEVSAGVRLLHAVGITTLLLTNAAGTVNPDFPPGTWMMLNDHLNLTGDSPLRGGPNFFDMSEVYSRRLRKIFRDESGNLDLALHEGVYAALPGPQYETPAEIRMLRTLGADAVGMSTVPEAIQARALGMEVAAFSCLTNWGAGISAGPLSHDEVTETGREVAGILVRLLTAALPKLPPGGSAS